MSHPDPTKTSDSKTDDGSSAASSICPRTFASLEYEVRSDMQHLIRNHIFRELAGEDEGEGVPDETTEPSDVPSTAAEELQTLAVEFMACVAEEKRCTSHRMRLKLQDPLAPGVTIDTPGAGMFFWRFWESLVDSATAAKPPLYLSEDSPSLSTAEDWDALAIVKRAADAKMDRALEVVRMAEQIKCEAAEGWTVWSRSARWSDLPLLESLVRDYQFGLFSAVSNHQDLPRPRIQRYVAGASLAPPDPEKSVRDLIAFRWKWLQLQRFSARLWNNIGRAEYFPHAIRLLDVLVAFSPKATGLPEMPEFEDELEEETQDVEDQPVVEAEPMPEGEPIIPPLDLSFYYAPPEPFQEQEIDQDELPISRAPVPLQLLLAEGASVWLAEATPALRRYINNTPLNELEGTWFGCGMETQQERNARWDSWKTALEAVQTWCAGENSRLPGEATVVASVERALAAMKDAEVQGQARI